MEGVAPRAEQYCFLPHGRHGAGGFCKNNKVCEPSEDKGPKDVLKVKERRGKANQVQDNDGIRAFAHRKTARPAEMKNRESRWRYDSN